MRGLMIGAVMAGLVGLAPAAEADRASAIVELRKEIKIKAVSWGAAPNLLYVAVYNDGSSRRGYAMYVCEVLREHSANRNILVIIVDAVRLAREKRFVRLGRASC